MTKHLLAHLTAAEARQRLAEHPVVLLPLGSLEDQGPHAPMGDFLSTATIAERIALRAAALGTDALAAPALPFGVADYFGHQPGAIAVSPATFRALLSEVLEALLRHDVRRLVIVNGHGGNAPVVHEVTLGIRRTRGIMIPSFSPWRIAHGLLAEILGREKAKAAGGHGADPLTSVAMYLFPDLIRPDLVPAPAASSTIMGLPVAGLGLVRFAGAEIQLPIEFGEAAPGGALDADARLSAAGTGATLVEKLADLGARFVCHYARETA